jgi:SpoIID/LytB domain protein
MRTRRTSVRAALVGALATTAVLAAGPVPAAPTAARLAIPTRATITVDGRGYGHGRGLSQYGAEGAARPGLSAGKILRFYYPHTTAGTFRGTVRVLISSDTDQNTTVVNRAGLKVRDLSTRTTFAVPSTGRIGKATRWRLSSRPGRPAQVSYLTDTWHVWRRLTLDGEFRAPGPIALVLPGGRTPYRGVLQSRTSTRNGSAPHRITVNKVSMEDYVRGVVPREAFPSWHQAALRAQAVAARSYAAYQMQTPLSSQYELCDTTACQVYGGAGAEVASTNLATARTAGQIRTYQGKPALTEFSSSNGGWTGASPPPSQVAQPDPYDGWPGNPHHRWTTSVTSAAIEKQWPALGNLTAITIDQRDGHGQWNGRVLSLTLHGSSHDVSLTGNDFRTGLALRSTWFTLSVAS